MEPEGYSTSSSQTCTSSPMQFLVSVLLPSLPFRKYICADLPFALSSGSSSGNSPGYGLTLVAETTSGCLISAECCASTGGISEGGGRAASGVGRGKRARAGAEEEEALLVPEDIGKVAAHALLEEINRYGQMLWIEGMD